MAGLCSSVWCRGGGVEDSGLCGSVWCRDGGVEGCVLCGKSWCRDGGVADYGLCGNSWCRSGSVADYGLCGSLVVLQFAMGSVWQCVVSGCCCCRLRSVWQFGGVAGCHGLCVAVRDVWVVALLTTVCVAVYLCRGGGVADYGLCGNVWCRNGGVEDYGLCGNVWCRSGGVEDYGL